MTLHPALVLLLSAALAAPASAQMPADPTAVSFRTAEASLLIGGAHPELFPNVEIDGFDYLEGTLQVEDESAKITWAPWLLNDEYNRWLSETRIQLGQADGITSLGLSFKFNPFNPRGPRGVRLWNELLEGRAGLSDPLGLTLAQEVRADLLAEQILDELTGSFGPCSAAASTVPLTHCAMTDEEIEAVIYRVDRDAMNPVLGELLETVRCALRTVSEQLEMAGPDRQKTEWAAILGTVAERSYIVERATCPGMTRLTALRHEQSALRAVASARNLAFAARQHLAYREALYSAGPPLINLSFVQTYFSVLGGDDVDSDDDGLADNAHRIRSRAATLTLDWRLGSEDGVSLLLSRSEERASAEAESPMADYRGFGVTWSHRLAVLDRDGFRKTKAYKKSLFVPSIAVGVAYARKDCRSENERCIEGILRSEALTPFVDFKLQPTAQFRIGVPLTRQEIFTTGTAERQESVEVLSLFALQLGGPG